VSDDTSLATEHGSATITTGAPGHALERTSELGSLIRSKDWSTTPIGPPERWSPTLKTVVDFLVVNRFPLLLWWGPEYVSIYNDAYRPILGTKHPSALGQPFREVWTEIDHILRPLIDAPFNGGPATWMDDILLEVRRHGFTEETHFTIAYSPVPDETAPRGIGGVLATVHEITEKIVGERRITVLRDLGACAGEARTPESACVIAARALVPHTKDIPFALLYLLDAGGTKARLAAASGLDANGAGAMPTVDVVGTQDVWRFSQVAQTKVAAVIDGLTAAMPRVPAGPWSDPPNKAVVLPIKSSLPDQLAGFLVAGISPRLRLDDQYSGFLDLVGAQVAASITTARAYEHERKRAEALAEIDRAKTLFFSNVSHEFRTPLSLIIGPLSDAQKRKEGLDVEQLDLVHRNSLRLLKLVNSLLDFSRIEAGRTQASYNATDLAALTAELASNYTSACERAGLALKVDCPALPAPVYVDRDMWEKIVLNLLSNAFKFTFEGGITVSLRQVDDMARLTVSDTGVGIPAPEAPLVFERFHRIEGQRSRTHEGSGIGLALVQELVKLHGGSITVESKVDCGTSFIVSVPLGNAHLPSDRPSAAATLPLTSVGAEVFVQEALRWLPDAADLSGEVVDDVEVAGLPPLRADDSVLVADDNADMRLYIRRLLGQACEVRAVTDGEAALRQIRQRRPSLVLADVMMPRMDGFQLLEAIRADKNLQDLPVILLSARAGEESRVEGLKAGATDYLVKPFSARELIARVSANLELARVRKEATAALRESERRFRALVTASSTIIYRMSPDWTKMLYLLGQDLIPDTNNPSSSWLETYIFPDDRPFVLKAINEAIRGKRLFQLEHRVRRVDGSVGWTLSRAVPLLDSDGEILEWFGAAMDVTERKHAEREVLSLAARSDQQRRLYETVLSNTPDLVYVFNLNHQFIYANNALLAMWGKTWIQAIGKTCLELGYEPWHADMHDREIDTVVATKKPIRGEVPFSGTQGRRTYDYIFVPVFGPDGEVEAVAGTTRDVTDRKKQEVALQHRTAQFATLLNQAPLGVYLVDADFKIREVNPTAAKLFSVIPDLIGRDFAEVIAILWPTDYAADLARIFRRTLETGEPFFMPERVEQRRDSGVVEVYEWQVHRIQQPDGRFGVVCYFRDISNQVSARERLTLLVNELNHRVKNTLATIQSVARQSLRNAPNLHEGQRLFDARIVALSKAHDILTREHWEGASLRKIVTESLAPHASNGSEHRLQFAGPEIRLRPKAALALSMALHELATNAVKYGAFSNANGTVKVDWSIGEDGQFALCWTEQGGPPVCSPDKRGFGSRLIEQGLSQDLGGAVALAFPSSGVVCSIRAPLLEVGGR
jgi:PAS domain S-box-containing protein